MTAPGIAFYSKYPTDKIIKVLEGSFDSNDITILSGDVGNMRVVAIPHGFNRPVFAKSLVRLTSVIPIGDYHHEFTYSDSTNIYIWVVAPQSVGTRTFDYTSVLSWVDDYDATNPLVPEFTQPYKPINFDSRENYQKILDQDSVTVSGTGVVTYDIMHDLGYKPNFLVHHASFTGEVWPSLGSSSPFIYTSTQNLVTATMLTDRLRVKAYKSGGGAVSCKVYYKIYLDDVVS